MTLETFQEEYDYLSTDVKKTKWNKFFEELASNPEQYEEYLKEILDIAVTFYLGEDYFGTEGLNI